MMLRSEVASTVKRVQALCAEVLDNLQKADAAADPSPAATDPAELATRQATAQALRNAYVGCAGGLCNSMQTLLQGIGPIDASSAPAAAAGAPAAGAVPTG